jgi:hypothetical protein
MRRKLGVIANDSARVRVGRRPFKDNGITMEGRTMCDQSLGIGEPKDHLSALSTPGMPIKRTWTRERPVWRMKGIVAHPWGLGLLLIICKRRSLRVPPLVGIVELFLEKQLPRKTGNERLQETLSEQ